MSAVLSLKSSSRWLNSSFIGAASELLYKAPIKSDTDTVPVYSTPMPSLTLHINACILYFRQLKAGSQAPLDIWNKDMYNIIIMHAFNVKIFFFWKIYVTGNCDRIFSSHFVCWVTVKVPVCHRLHLCVSRVTWPVKIIHMALGHWVINWQLGERCNQSRD